MLLDLYDIPDDGANDGLECLCKARSEGDESIWALHPSVFLRSLVEGFTDNGLSVSAAMAEELLSWLAGKHHRAPRATVQKPPIGPWSASELPMVHAWLASKTPEQYTFSDWSMLADYIVSVHAPPTFVSSHAGWMAARATLMGKLEASIPALALAAADNALASLPSTVEQALAAFKLSPAEVGAMQLAEAHCADAIVGATSSLRAGIKREVLREMSGPHAPGVPSHALQTRLFDAFGQFNKDWRRIAVTEAGEAKNQGFIASLPVGAAVRRVEHYRGACSFCARLNGRVFTVVDAASPDKDGETQVWPGKSNIGRSASANKIVDGQSVPREPDELWWPAAGVQHPHCRGSWVPQTASVAGTHGAQWDAWLVAIGARNGGGKR